MSLSTIIDRYETHRGATLNRSATLKKIRAYVAGVLATALALTLSGCDSDALGPTDVRGDLVHVDGQRGNDQNPGTRDEPFATIGSALALTQGEVTVYVAGGTYSEVIMPRSNVHIYGGFDGASWTRTGERTIVGAESRAAIIRNVDAVTLDGLTLVASDDGRREHSSVAVAVHASSAIVISRNELIVARGLAGGAGEDPARPSRGGNGGVGEDRALCGPALNQGGAGGSSTNSHDGGNGGSGRTGAGNAGVDGFGPRGGAGGARGDAQAEGHDGANGAAGSAGGDGDGGASFGRVESGGYIRAHGSAGENGIFGSGGGGGGAGYGSEALTCGSAGGGGGEGGLGGGGGGGGGAGGGAFGVIVTGNSQVNVTGNRIETAGGGDGGRGGVGALGGASGSGGAGGSRLGAGYDGGDGGDGGSGGRGGDGGGGGGGPSIGIATDGTGTLTNTSNTFQIGPAGAAGSSAGQAGAAGVAAEVHGTG
jgi:hypothetical protein